ncbi:MAG: chemotaxis protein CheX [Chloroflexi bacterium]|nr:chemotaxis protein CheX [Chloroflexota bacterium]
MDGNVLYGFDNDTARSVASVMLGRSVEVLDEMVVSAIEELADLISGSAANELAMAGYLSVINPPMMYQSAGLGFTPIKVKQIQVDFVSSLGSLHVRIGLSERLGRSQEVSWLQMQH